MLLSRRTQAWIIGRMMRGEKAGGGSADAERAVVGVRRVDRERAARGDAGASPSAADPNTGDWERDELLFQPAWSAFAHLLDAFFEAIERPDLRGNLWLHRRLISYSEVEFFVWLEHTFQEAVDGSGSMGDLGDAPLSPAPRLD
jgi:hypothetical protein